jgi:hypothetical protein
MRLPSLDQHTARAVSSYRHRSVRGLRRTADHLRHHPCRDRPPSSQRPSSRGRWLASSAASDCRAGPSDAAPSAGARSVEPPSCSARGEGPRRQRGQPTSRRAEEADGLFRLDASLDESYRAKVRKPRATSKLTVLNDTGGLAREVKRSGVLKEARWPGQTRGTEHGSARRGVTLSGG